MPFTFEDLTDAISASINDAESMIGSGVPNTVRAYHSGVKAALEYVELLIAAYEESEGDAFPDPDDMLAVAKKIKEQFLPPHPAFDPKGKE